MLQQVIKLGLRGVVERVWWWGMCGSLHAGNAPNAAHLEGGVVDRLLVGRRQLVQSQNQRLWHIPPAKLAIPARLIGPLNLWLRRSGCAGDGHGAALWAL